MAQSDVSENEVSEKERKDKIVAEAKEFFRTAQSYWSEIYQKANADDIFASGVQWDPALLAEREAEGRPSLVINKIPQFINQIANEARKNKPGIKVNPTGDGAKQEIAKIRQGMIRNIEYESDAQIAYSVAAASAARKSIGFFGIKTDYESWDSFDQVIRFFAIHNALSVLIDPNSVELDGKDMNRALLYEDMPKEEFEAQYPDADSDEPSDFKGLYDEIWADKENRRVVDYYVKRFETIELVQYGVLENNVPVVKIAEKSEVPKGAKVLKTRVSMKVKVMHYKISACDVLDETEIVGEYIPIVPVYGARNFVNGKWELESVHRHAQDSQRIYNYSASGEVEAIALVPKAPYLAEERQIPLRYADMWATSNKKTYGYLPYVHIDGVPMPSRNTFEPATGALTQSKITASDDIKATTGIFDDSLGRNTQNKSGIALARTQQQSATSNYHFVDNQSISIKHGGRIVNGMLDSIYDTGRQVRLVGEDGSQETQIINQPYQDESGQQLHHDISVGKYDVTIDVGPNYDTKRQESKESLLGFAQSFPQQASVIVDLIAKNMDFPDSQLLAERLKKTLPPGISDDKNKQPIPPEAQQQMQQMSQMIEHLTETANKQSEIIKTKSNELESKERIEMAKLQNQATIELAKIESNEALTVLGHAVQKLDQRLSQLDFGQPFDEESNELGNEAVAQQGQDNGN
jgi:hypothetical protein